MKGIAWRFCNNVKMTVKMLKMNVKKHILLLPKYTYIFYITHITIKKRIKGLLNKRNYGISNVISITHLNMPQMSFNNAIAQPFTEKLEQSDELTKYSSPEASGIGVRLLFNYFDTIRHV